MGKVFRVVADGDNIWIEGVEDAAPTFETCDDCIAPEHCAREGSCLFDAVASVTTLRDATLEQLHQEASRRRDELDAWKAQIDESDRAAPEWARRNAEVMMGLGKIEPVPFEFGGIPMEECTCGKSLVQPCAECWEAGTDADRNPREVRGLHYASWSQLTEAIRAKLRAEMAISEAEVNRYADDVISKEVDRLKASKADEGAADEGEALPLRDWLEGYDEPLSEAHSNTVSDPDALLLLNVAGMLMRKGVTVEGIIARMCVFE